MKRIRSVAVVAIAAGALGVATRAAADPITLSVMSGPSLQQIDNRPCIIGDPSCQNKDTIPYTLIPPHDPSDTISSPTYTVDQIRSLVGSNTFFVGIDLNQAMGHDGGAYTLTSFTMSIDGVVAFSTAAPKVLTPLNPGNGFSDASITGFDLSGLGGSQTIVFTATFSGATAGREQYFLQGGSPEATPGPAPGAPTPEPASLLLLATGLGSVVVMRSRRRTR